MKTLFFYFVRSKERGGLMGRCDTSEIWAQSHKT